MFKPGLTVTSNSLHFLLVPIKVRSIHITVYFRQFRQTELNCYLTVTIRNTKLSASVREKSEHKNNHEINGKQEQLNTTARR